MPLQLLQVVSTEAPPLPSQLGHVISSTEQRYMLYVQSVINSISGVSTVIVTSLCGGRYVLLE
jgi:hypothetical protein